jgi:hypothetical protein
VDKWFRLKSVSKLDVGQDCQLVEGILYSLNI